MRERLEQILKIICVGLAVLLLVQLVKVAIHMNPLSGVVIPELPTLPADTNAPPKVVNKPPAKTGTNAAVAAMTAATNTSLASANTNSTQADTNMVSPAKLKEVASNSGPILVSTELRATNELRTNVSAAAGLTDTNVITPKVAVGTNAAGVESVHVAGTNAVAAKKSGTKNPAGMPPPMMTMMGGPGGGKAAKLPPEVPARVDRVTESEILAPVDHPMPMALLGIAGKLAFLRSPSGQTGLVKEGDDLGEIKLLRIGTNRVLVEQDGQKKELMIFAGFGGESLLPKSTETSDETTKK